MADINDLLVLMTRLRDPASGCPWDIEQNFSTIAPYTLEEACEVLDAIEREDYENLHEELGDLLFQVVFHARIAEESGHFDFSSIVDGLVNKLLRRHPHVFPQGTLDSWNNSGTALSPAQVKKRWQAMKQKEKQTEDDSNNNSSSALPDSLPAMLPSLKKAEKIQQAAARAGFDWDTSEQVHAKIKEELQEVSEASTLKEGKNRVTEEVGDLLFACVNYARHLDIDPEMALRAATKKFDGRFRQMEIRVKEEGKTFEQLSLDQMENYWQQIKTDDNVKKY